MRKIVWAIFCMFILLCNINLINGQELNNTNKIKLSGIVKSESSELLVGVTVIEKGTTNGTTTDLGGKFEISVNPKSILEFSYIGYETQNINIENVDVLKDFIIVLKMTSHVLEDIVVIGYGTEKKKVSTAATSLVTSDQLVKTVSTRMEQAIQGKMAGVSVSQNSGSPGADLAVRIRGIGTPNNSDPLYIVDGIRAGGLDFLNPGDIERVDVLKDAASAAIYGVSASNGVILITTKKGTKDKFEVNYSGYGGIQQLERKVSLLNAYQYNDLYGYGTPAYSTDWQDAVIGDAPITNHVLSFNGGGKTATYNISSGYYKQLGIIGAPIAPDKSAYERITFRSSVQGEMFNRFIARANVNFTYLTRRSLPENNDIIGVVPRLLNFSPSVPIYNETTGNPYYDTKVASDLRNPVSTILTHEQNWTQFKTFSDITLEYEFIKNLKLSVTHNIDYAEAKEKIFQPSYSFSAQDNRVGNLLNENRYTWFNWTNQGILSYNLDFLKVHKFSAIAGYSVFESNYEKLTATNTALTTNKLSEANLGLATGGNTGAGTGATLTSRSLLSFFGRVNYSYKEKYVITSNLRVDGSSRFGSNNRFAILPSVSASWVMSEEPFFNKIKNVVNSSKLRVSWGVNGNEEIGDYGYYSRIYTAQRYVLGTSSTEINGSTISTVPNSELKWETSSQFDVGLDLAFFNGLLVANMDYYYKQTDDVLVTVPIPGQVGFYASTVNAGSVLNQGVEIELSHSHKVGKLKYSVTSNITYLDNKVTSLGNGGQPIWAGNIFHLGDNVSKTQVGSPIASFFTYQTKGVFQNSFEISENVGPDGVTPIQPNALPGDFRYVDVNNDGKLSDDDKIYQGKPLPDVIANLSFNLEFMNFDLYMLFDASFGNSVFRGYAGYNWGPVNQQVNILNAWKKEGDGSKFPGLSTKDSDTRGQGYVNKESLRSSNFFVENASFMKIRNLQIGYTLPKKITKKTPIGSLRIYASIQNLATITSYSGFDPEIGKIGSNDNSRGSLELGIDKGFYPSARTFTFGLELKLR